MVRAVEGIGSAHALPMTAADAKRVAKRKLPFGFRAPPKKKRRKKK